MSGIDLLKVAGIVFCFWLLLEAVIWALVKYFPHKGTNSGLHNFYECAKDCTGCIYCNGGLAHCTICGGAEASLPTDCPGEKMSQQQQDNVQAGNADFKNGVWICLDEVPGMEGHGL